MLHWFAGPKAGEDPDATGNIEAPETPAPVFAVRAFKHALFGTPQTVQTKPRRHSNAEYGRPKTLESKASRPSMNRPQSTSDAQKLVKQEVVSPVEPLVSPSKGILLTPGAAAARKKNVTFGEHVVDNEEKRPLKSGLPDDCPGKFPSPWNKGGDESKKRDESPNNRTRGRNKLTEALEQVRDESRRRKSDGDKVGNDDHEELAAEFADPRSESGKFWKREYDIYRTNTQREVRKLVTKQRAAKSFAQMKDSQCTELSDELREEQKKVEGLEVKTRELETLIKDLQDRLRQSQDAEKKYQQEITILKRQSVAKDYFQTWDGCSQAKVAVERGELARRSFHGRTHSFQGQGQRQVESNKRLSVEEKPKDSPVQQPSEPYNASSNNVRFTTGGYRGRDNYRADEAQIKSTDAIWAQLDSSSNPVVSHSAKRQSSASKGGHIVTSGTDATPLKSLNINTVPMTKQDSSPRSMDVERESGPDLEQVESKSAGPKKDEQLASPLLSPALPFSSSEIPPMGPSSHANATTQTKGSEHDNSRASKHIADSNPFQTYAKPMPSKPAASVSTSAVEAATVAASNTKENISPASKSHMPPQELNMKPSVLWSSISGATAGNRKTSVTGKDGRELSRDRIEAARARIAARGRVTS